MKNNSKIWSIIWLITAALMLMLAAGRIAYVDPYFHYHKPYTDKYYYRLDDDKQRSQNDGICRHFEYDALITGTSMTENFSTSEFDRLFGTKSIKVSYSGASLKETNQCIEKALKYNQNLKIILKSLDMTGLMQDKDWLRQDLGEYPEYLYDENPFNDVKYLLNKDILLRVYDMDSQRLEKGFLPGILSFDEYSNWMRSFTFGVNAVRESETELAVNMNRLKQDRDLSDEVILANIHQNITDITEKNPDVEFYCFMPPYSIRNWEKRAEAGDLEIYRRIEELLIEELLKHDNIKYFSFNDETEIICDLNNYKDTTHYASWINSFMLRRMRQGKNLLTRENYEKYLEKTYRFYQEYDYSQIDEQEDYEDDLYAAVLISKELSDAVPLKLFDEISAGKELLNKAEFVQGQYEGEKGLICRGTMNRGSDEEMELSESLINGDYVGARIELEDISDYRCLVFYGRKLKANGQPGVYLFDENGQLEMRMKENYFDLDDSWKRYTLDVTELEGRKTIIFNGGYTDNSGSTESEYCFSGATLY